MPPSGLPEAPPGPRLGQLRAAGPRTAPGGTPRPLPAGARTPGAPLYLRALLRPRQSAKSYRRTGGRACRGERRGSRPGPAPGGLLRAGAVAPALVGASGRGQGPAAGRELRGQRRGAPAPGSRGQSPRGGGPGLPSLPGTAPPCPGPARRVPSPAARARLPLPIKPPRRQSGGTTESSGKAFARGWKIKWGRGAGRQGLGGKTPSAERCSPGSWGGDRCGQPELSQGLHLPGGAAQSSWSTPGTGRVGALFPHPRGKATEARRGARPGAGRARGTFRGLGPGTSTRAAPGAHPQAVEKVAQSRISGIFRRFLTQTGKGERRGGSEAGRLPGAMSYKRAGMGTAPSQRGGQQRAGDRHGPRRHTLTPHTPGPAA